MHTTLYLTTAEQRLFDALPAELRDGWTVESENQSYDDTPERRQVRMDLMELDDGRIESMILDCGPECDPEKLQDLASKIDLTGLSARDLWEIFFALGPDAMSHLISRLLVDAQDDKVLEGIMAFTHLRHELLASLSSR